MHSTPAIPEARPIAGNRRTLAVAIIPHGFLFLASARRRRPYKAEEPSRCNSKRIRIPR
jgi:hypothetical protein